MYIPLFFVDSSGIDYDKHSHSATVPGIDSLTCMVLIKLLYSLVYRVGQCTCDESCSENSS